MVTLLITSVDAGGKLPLAYKTGGKLTAVLNFLLVSPTVNVNPEKI
jgi:hypothetical protein